jgi:hypothetical protein
MSLKTNTRASLSVKPAKSSHRSPSQAVKVVTPESRGSLIDAAPEKIIKLPIRPSRGWKQTLEKYLIEEGLTPAKARELVELAAS